MKNLNELLAAINKETVMTKDWEDPNYLSDLLLRLASYYSSLGPLIAAAERDELQAKSHYEAVMEKIKVEKIDAGEAVKRSESKAKIEVAEDIEAYIDLRYKARLLFLTRQNLDKTMDAIRSSLAQQGREKEGVRHAV